MAVRQDGNEKPLREGNEKSGTRNSTTQTTKPDRKPAPQSPKKK
mgnify:CR=1 FL=1|jgi:hypothetical protein